MAPLLILALAVVAQTETGTSAGHAPEIELITMGPGPYLYSYWGHSALRVFDREQNLDRVYNFGSVDFSEGFFVRMLRGQVDAFIGISTFAATAQAYSAEDRTLTRRVLELPPATRQRVAAALAELASSNRSHYRYHHFTDNCSTRVADVIDDALDGQLSKASTAWAEGTFREHALHAVGPHAWVAVGIDLCVTGVVDKPITHWDLRFLPVELDAIVDSATVAGGRPLVSFSQDVYRTKNPVPKEWSWPWIQIYLLLGVPLAVLLYLRPRIGLTVFGLVSGLVGSALLLLWLGTGYDFVQQNWNVLVLPPTNLALPYLGRRPQLLRPYLGALILLLILLAAGLRLGVVGQAIGPTIGFALPLTAAALLGVRRSPG